jgi:dihydroflavonol-4-reductase
MLVAVTGGTGYVGSHAVAKLAREGHRVRVLARSAERIPTALLPLGVDADETAVGDVTDPAAVERALEGCDAVLHAASVFSMDARRAEEVRAVNVRATETVLGTAHRLVRPDRVRVERARAAAARRRCDIDGPFACRAAGLALLPVEGGFRTGGTQVPGSGRADREHLAGGIWGPQDPHLGEGVTLASNVLRKRFPIVMNGGMHITDVRDVAAVLATVMETGRGPRSYMVAGEYISLPDLIRLLGELTGRRIRFVIFPRWFLATFGRVADVMQQRLKSRLPWQGEGIWVINCAARCDDSTTRSELGLQPRPLRDTLADTVRWLAEIGHLSSAEAGSLTNDR